MKPRTRKLRTGRKRPPSPGPPGLEPSKKARNLTLLLGDRLHHERVAPPEPRGRDAEFRFSVPVLRVHDVEATVAWYASNLGFSAAPFPDKAPHDFALIRRDGVQLLVRHSTEHDTRAGRVHSGWDLYIWVDGADFDHLEAAAARADAIVRRRRAMGNHIAEIEVRDPDGYVICIGGPIRAATVRRA